MPHSHIDSRKQKCLFMLIRLENFQEFPPLLQESLFFKNSNIETNITHSKHKKTRRLCKPEVITIPSPEEEGVNQLRDKKIMPGYPAAELNFTLRHQRSLAHMTGYVRTSQVNLHIPGKSWQSYLYLFLEN